MICSECGKPFNFDNYGYGFLCPKCLMFQFDNDEFTPIIPSTLEQCRTCGIEKLEADLSMCTLCGNLICDNCIEYQDEGVTYCDDCYN